MSSDQSNYKLSPELLDAMRDNDYKMKHDPYETSFSEAGHVSPNDVVRAKLEELDHELSEPLKKIHSIWLARSAKNCYQEKHISEDFTNLQQINLCKEKTKDNLLGSFYSEVTRRRTTDAYTLNNCILDAKNQVNKLGGWVDDYINNIVKTNKGLVSDFKEQYSKYI